jgi:hypothetical protein
VASLPITGGEHDAVIGYAIVVAHKEWSQASTADTFGVVAYKAIYLSVAVNMMP